MKKCPFCAEQIQDEAIKCRFCHSLLDDAPDASPPDAAAARVRDEPHTEKEPRPLKPATRASDEPQRERRVLYQGAPSWRAYVGPYFVVVLGTLLIPAIALWIASRVSSAGAGTKFAVTAIPVVLGALAFWGVNLYRKSKLFRVTTSNIETEYGLLSKKIDVLELWRCRDVRYRQSVFDRILGIAHIEIFTADVTTPNLCILGLPASRQLFENIRDSIEIQRQSRNVVGFVQ